ncbi:hypothetical protein JCM3775_005704 [Rhodotorula graminis]
MSSPAVARLEPAHCTYTYFRQHHLLPNTPCLFPRTLVERWPLLSRWLDKHGNLDWNHLEDQYGALDVTCIDLAPVADEPAPSTFASLLHLWRRGDGRAKYLKDWHLPLAVFRAGERDVKGKGKERVRDEVYEVPDVCLDDWLNEYEGDEGAGRRDDFRFVYVGGGDTFTPLHRDVYSSYSISTQIYGSKRWYLFPPSCTPSLRPLIVAAERQGSSVNCDAWPDVLKADFRAQGMLVVEQAAGETIFVPSGWFHSVHNLSHPTLSLNHNWLNSHILPAVYSALAYEAARCREAVDDVRDMLVEQARREGKGEDGWRREWEETVDGLVERSEGWSWPTFWRMTLNTLSNLDVSTSTLAERARRSRWPPVPPEVRPSVAFVVSQVRPLVDDFCAREEQEWRWLDGLDRVLEEVEGELERLAM